MRIARAILIKRETADGLISVFEHVPLGKEYLVDLDTRRIAKGYNVPKKQIWEKEIINCYGVDGGWWPTEMLEIKDVKVINLKLERRGE